MGARSTSDKAIRKLLKQKLGKVYEIDETFVDYIVGLKGGRFEPAALPRQEAGVVERVLELAGYPAKMREHGKGGYWVWIPKIIPAR